MLLTDGLQFRDKREHFGVRRRKTTANFGLKRILLPNLNIADCTAGTFERCTNRRDQFSLGAKAATVRDQIEWFLSRHSSTVTG